jgi:hypothetical protein
MNLKNKTYSVFLNEKFVEKDKKLIWIKEHIFYHGDLSKLNDDDWRIREVPKKRKKSIFLGIVQNLEFPVKYPIQLSNGDLIGEITI